MSVCSKDIIAEARKHLGTPFHHQGRQPGLGLDCAGLIVVVGQALGVLDPAADLKRYPRIPDGRTLQNGLERFLLKTGRTEGGIGLFWIHRTHLPTHVCIFTDSGMIHAYANEGRVVEHVFDSYWQARLVETYKYPGVV
jgi:cell wall-associated NlpC family hydrolase